VCLLRQRLQSFTQRGGPMAVTTLNVEGSPGITFRNNAPQVKPRVGVRKSVASGL